MIGRRTLLAAPLAVAVGLRARTARAAGEPASGRLGFRVFRKGSEIGTHTLQFHRTGNVLTVNIDVQIAVGFGPITLFRYRLTGVEVWREDRFAEIETATDDDGKMLHVSARRDGNRIVVDANPLGRQNFPAEALPLTHWNIGCMTAPLFNPQDGKAMQVTVTPRGSTSVALANGASVPARQFAMTGQTTLDDYYDADAVWTALHAVATDGSMLDYKRIV